MKNELIIKETTKEDIPVILSFIKQLAEYEKLSSSVTATEELLEKSLFGKKPVCECVIGYLDNKPVCFALYFYNFSTFVGKPGLYLEDLFVLPTLRGKGFGKTMLKYLIQLAKDKDCGRFEWSVLSWNTSAINFYKSLGAQLMDEWQIFRITNDKFDNSLNL